MRIRDALSVFLPKLRAFSRERKLERRQIVFQSHPQWNA